MLLSLFCVVLPFEAMAGKGELLTLKMHDSKIYPGTERKITVYVPQEYDGRTPACLWVSMSGPSGLTAEILDRMIGAGELPTIIGVFIGPGQIRNAEGSTVRYNRSNELDAMDGRYAKFIETEVLPAVCKLKTSDGRGVRLSARAADRAIYGNSSGGICAFNVAWQRPDLFSRVYASCGTFVSFRGGDQFPALIRKCEPRPIRVFLQDNDKDTWNPLFGSWFEYNQMVLSALQFAGYDVNHSWDEGGHSSQNARRIMPDVLRWLWRGWPAAVEKGRSGSKTLASILVEGEEWRCVADNIPAGAMLHPYSEERIVMVAGRNKELVATDGSRSKAKGRVTLSDPYTAIFPGGVHTAKRIEGSNWVWDYINMPDGKLSHGQRFYFLYADAGQILYDGAGYLYVASSVGIQVCDHNGRVRTILSLPGGAVESIAFAGHNLFAISDGKLYVRRLQRTGTHSGRPKQESQG